MSARMHEDDSGLAELFPTNPVVEINGEKVRARKFRAFQFREAGEHIMALRSSISGGHFDAASAFSESFDAVVELIALSTGKDRAWFEAEDAKGEDGIAGEMIELASLVFELNADTILKKIEAALPRFKALGARLKALTGGEDSIGLTSSSVS